MGKLRWKKDAPETGLARVGAGPRGSHYHDGEKIYATVNALGGNWQRPLAGWFWVAGWDSGIPHKNTCQSPCKDEATAKAEAAAYVKQHLTALERSHDGG